MAALFQTTINTIHLSDMFTACTAIILEANDGLPQLICTICLSNLVAAYEFQMQCINTDHEIRTILGYVNTENQEVVTTSASMTIVKDATEQHKMQAISVIKVEDAMGPKLYGIESVPCGNVENNRTTEIYSDSIKVPKRPTNIDTNSDEVTPPNQQQQHDKESDYELEDTLPLKPKSLSNELTTNGPQTTAKPKRELTHKCTICNKTFDKAYRLLRHSTVHNATGKPYECEICKFRFATDSRLIRHKIKHTDLLQPKNENIGGSKVFPCLHCTREFTKIESLSSHLKVHKQQTGTENASAEDKEFLCEFCPKKFPKLNLLTRHLKIHDEIKAHKCNVCDRTFALGGQLIDHMNKHKGVRPHVCTYCNKGMCVGVCA